MITVTERRLSKDVTLLTKRVGCDLLSHQSVRSLQEQGLFTACTLCKVFSMYFSYSMYIVVLIDWYLSIMLFCSRTTITMMTIRTTISTFSPRGTFPSAWVVASQWILSLLPSFLAIETDCGLVARFPSLSINQSVICRCCKTLLLSYSHHT